MTKSRLIRLIWRSLRLLLLLWVTITLAGFLLANSMAFFPPPSSYPENAPDLIHVPVTEDQSLAIIALWHPDARLHVIHAHGNAEDAGQLRHVYEAYRGLGVSVLGLDYRGYGQSDGRPGIQRAKADVRAVYDYLVDEKNVDPGDIVLHGRSLGTAMVLPLAATAPVGGVILESSLLNGFRTMIPLPLFPLDPIPNHQHIRNLSAPVLFVHGENDRVIPIEHGRGLYRRAPDPKEAYWIPDVGHNDLVPRAWPHYWERIATFLDSL